MNRVLCHIDDCDQSKYCRGMCRRHYTRWRRYGDPRAGRVLYGLPLVSRWSRYVRPTIDCWFWEGYIGKNGYGYLSVPVDGRSYPRLAHRIGYEALIGPIPDGLHLDHLCRTPACVNPVHLEPVTSAENTRRGNEARRVMSV